MYGLTGALSAPATRGAQALCCVVFLWLQQEDCIAAVNPIWSVQTEKLGESISYNRSGKRSIITDIDLMHKENQKGRNKNRMEDGMLPLHSQNCVQKIF